MEHPVQSDLTIQKLITGTPREPHCKLCYLAGRWRQDLVGGVHRWHVPPGGGRGGRRAGAGVGHRREGAVHQIQRRKQRRIHGPWRGECVDWFQSVSTVEEKFLYWKISSFKSTYCFNLWWPKAAKPLSRFDCTYLIQVQGLRGSVAACILYCLGCAICHTWVLKTFYLTSKSVITTGTKRFPLVAEW